MNEFYPKELEDEEERLIQIRREAVAPGKPKDEAKVGFALSGGGIRSATFCLGVFQALARRELLHRIDFLSTVSGGGYFGAFLGRLFTRPWVRTLPQKTPVEGVEQQLGKASSEPMKYLRDNGRYLSPNGAGDTWAMVVIFLRNWLAVLGGLLTFAWCASLVVVLVRAVLWGSWPLSDCERWFLQATNEHWWWSPMLLLPLVVLGVAVVPLGWAYWLTQVTWSKWPVVRRAAWAAAIAVMAGAILVWCSSERSSVRWGVGVAGAEALLAMSLYVWVRAKAVGWDVPGETYKTRNKLTALMAGAMAVAVGLLALAFVDSLGQSLYALQREGQGIGGALAVLGGGTGLSAVVVAASRLKFLLDLLPKSRAVQLPLELVAGLAASVLVIALLTLASVGAHAVAWRGMPPEVVIGEAGLTVRPGANLAAQEHPAETNSVCLSACRCIKVAASQNGKASKSTAFSVSAIRDLRSFARRVSEGRRPVDAWFGDQLSPETMEALVAYSGKGADEELQTNILQVVNRLVMGASIYDPGRFEGVHLGPETTALLKQKPERDNVAHLNRVLLEDAYPGAVPRHACRPDVILVLGALVVAVVLAWLFGQTLAFINLSSLHAMYTARLTRAYLGASNEKRWKGKGRSISEPIPGDDVDWRDYKPWEAGGPLHVVNVTLNETVSGKTQIEYRDRKGLNFAVGPAGLSVGRTDHAVWREGSYRAEAGKPLGRIGEWWERCWLRQLVEWVCERADRPEAYIEPLAVVPKEFHALGMPTDWAEETTPAKGKVHWCEAANLGRWVGISGAAFTTGLGSRTSLAKSLLLGLLNVRLGYWWTSGIKPRERDRVCAAFSGKDLINLPGLAERLVEPSRPVDEWLVSRLSPKTKRALRNYSVACGAQKVRTKLLKDLKRLLEDPEVIVTRENLDGVKLRRKTKELFSKVADKVANEKELVQLKRLVLEDAYEGGVKRCKLLAGSFLFSDDELLNLPLLADRLKPADSAVDRWVAGHLSPETRRALRCVILSVVERLRARLLEDLNLLRDPDVSLAGKDIVEMKVRWKSKRLLLRTPKGDDLVWLKRLLVEDAYGGEIANRRFSVRTQRRLWNKIEGGLSWAFPVQMHLVQELTARFHGPALERWYLSDGGHFENTGAYELLRRRVRYIVVCDSGCDPEYGFEDVANLVRKARIDFGAKIEFLDRAAPELLWAPPSVSELIGTPEEFRLEASAAKDKSSPRRTKRHALLARVDYRDKKEGSYILFLKPSVTGDDEPLDLLNYQKEHPAFPNESTADQYFDEAQWESYRLLGHHISERLFPGRAGGACWFFGLPR